MIPSVLAHQLRHGVEGFLHTTFPVSTPFFHKIVDRLLTDDGGVFKGPYLSIQLPFRAGTVGADCFPRIPMKFAPHLHQQQAFERLRDPRCKSTIVATGTGSGKTEAFLYPIFDYVLRHRQPGVKALLIYPMNALASDQAMRIARIIDGSDELRGRVTAGLYVGDQEQSPHKTMTPDGCITDRETMRLSPPDILLTNYKMLDYLLLRPRDQALWAENGPETLRYLVVDELHTFDGAQGTDLACLVRRLKSRLQMPKGFLCCVGTSATLGTDDQRDGLLKYANEVFGETFDTDAVVGETRLTAGEFLADSLIEHIDLVAPSEEEALDPDSYDDENEWLAAQHRLWFTQAVDPGLVEDPHWRVALGERLTRHLFFQNLVKVLGGATRSYTEVLRKLQGVMPDLRRGSDRYRFLLLDSIIGLVSAARRLAPLPDGVVTRVAVTAPFLNVRVQLWLRELSRLVASVSDPPALHFSADLKNEAAKVHLPVVHCRGCGAMGWTALRGNTLKPSLTNNLDDYYPAFFKSDKRVVFMFPELEDLLHEMTGEHRRLCTACLRMGTEREKACDGCGGSDAIRVFVPASTIEDESGKKVGVHHCPYCGGRNGLTLMGARAASLTSVLVSQLFASRYNDHKKLLTFSDSVQDASHRAGFFGARTFAFTLRCGLLKFLVAHDREVALDRLADAFRDWWLARMTPEDFAATYISPDLTWLAAFEKLVEEGTLEADSTLLDNVCKRLDWELASEFGFRARLGRTLEKTASAMARPAPDRLADAFDRIELRLSNEIGGLRQVDPDDARRFVLGFITRLRYEGAIHHDGLDGYASSLGNTFLVRRIRWMARFGPNTPAPSFLATSRGKERRFDVLVGTSQTWYEQWLSKCLSAAHPLVLNDTRAIYDIVLQGLIAAGIIEEREADGANKVWGLRPDALLVTRQVSTFACDRCEHRSAQASPDQGLWDGAPCLRGSCSGRYRPRPVGRDYYARLYQSGDLVRIYTAEHTGLLSRDDREKVEARFKAPADAARPGDPNLLSCTPTLEMGIDIGDLSSLILCSVPPSQASYLQRIGRAGRRDGNALNVTMARSYPHDLYFFSEPEEMIAGAIAAPGVFLDASAVLERQLTAFCLDRWVATGITNEQLPRTLGKALEAVEKQNTSAFPYPFIHYVELHQTEIFDAFIALFEGRLSADSVEHLRTFLAGSSTLQGSLGWRIVDGLQRVALERESLRKKARTVADKIKAREQLPAQDKNHEQELGEMRREKSALSLLARQFGDRDTLAFFTDEGLIPNYAFPEAGVVLRSVIYRKKDTEGSGPRYQQKTFDYERPAATAIAELAPANRFYAGKRRVTVDQVDMSVSGIEWWRFCDQCSHSERIDTGDDHKTCQRCASPLWSDSGQKRSMLRLRQVFANTEDRKSRIDDDSDARDPMFYNRQMLVDFDPAHVRKAWQVESDEMPFGFELVQRVAFREINFGQRSEEAQKVTIAGVELPRKGFMVCRSCGKVQMKKDEPAHAFSCTSRDKTTSKPMIDCVYLYRDFTSEAIRIMLPMTTLGGSDRKLHSLVAALHLGLTKHFAGRIDHLRTTSYDEPIADSTFRKRYLVLYDTVPGGTGYLKDLMRAPEHLLGALQQALDTLRACRCNQDPERDGCYRCLLAHRGRLDLKDISRDEAVALLSDILRLREKIVPVQGLTFTNENALFDSELEQMFIEALNRMRSATREMKLTKELLGNGKPGYLLKIGTSAWYIELQVPLGPNDGVAVPSKADFVFRPASPKMSARPVVVFTDGFRWHRDRVGLDTAQRMAIGRSGLHCWSLSYHDVQNRLSPRTDWYENPLVGGANEAVIRGFLESRGLADLLRLASADSFEWLVTFLEKPDAIGWGWYAFAHALGRLDPALDGQAWLASMGERLPDEMVEEMTDGLTDAMYGRGGHGDGLQWFACIDKAKSRDLTQMRFACRLDDAPETRESGGFERIWNGYLRLLNLFGFLRAHWFVTPTGIDQGCYHGLPVAYPLESVPEAQAGLPDDWQGVVADCLVDVSTLLPRLHGAGWTIPHVSYELQDASGRIVGSAELAWPDEKIAFLREDEMTYASTFLTAGWKTALLTVTVSDETIASLRPSAKI